MNVVTRRTTEGARRAAAVLAAPLLAAGCAPAADPAPRATPVDLPPAPPAAATTLPVREPVSPVVVADGAPLGDGLQTFTGMVRPTKAGLDVRGVVFDDDTLPRALGQTRSEPLLGAMVAITADLVRHDVAPQPPGEPAIQMRSGTWHGVRKLERARVVAAPVVIEGVVTRSKGLVSVGEHRPP